MEMEVLGRRNSKCKGPKVRKLSMSEKANNTWESWNKVSGGEMSLES